MSPWDKFRPRWTPLDPEGSCGVNRVGDMYYHDELTVTDGDFRSEVVGAVVANGLMRRAALLNATVRWPGLKGHNSLLSPPDRGLLRRLVATVGGLVGIVTHV